MSKIYKALERAEQERRSHRDPFPIFTTVEKAREEERTAPLPVQLGDIPADKPLISLFQPGSLVAEQFRKLRTYLLRLNATENVRTILVTSTAQGEGKSFVSANLAIGISNDLHNHALLVDCDLRNPMLSKWFGAAGGKGLSHYLRGKAEIPEIINNTGVENLSLIPAGNVEDLPGDLFGSGRMKALVQELKSWYSDQIILFDSTPLLATTEPEILAKLVDGIILVVRAGVTKRETLVRAVSSLGKEKILGVVLNGLTLKSAAMHRRYFGSNGYYHKYGYGEKNPPARDGWKRLLRRK